jgi:hypothetical protein
MAVTSLISRVRTLQRVQKQLASPRRVRPQPVPPLCEFVTRTSPARDPPLHLRPYVEVLEQALKSEQRIVLAAPPQHGKTETTLHAFPWWIKQAPSKRFAYVTYAQERSDSASIKARAITERASCSTSGTIRHWQTGGGGEVFWTSIGGPLTGEGIDGVLVIDDPVKDRKDADSEVMRERAIAWLDDVAMTRVHPRASVIVMATRWHPDDLPGKLIKRGWKYINLQAICEEPHDPLGRALGEPLWPDKRPLAFLESHRKNPFTWASLYQGRPRPRGGTVFGQPTYFRELPNAYRVGYGIDLAYTRKTSADHSVCIRLFQSGDLYYVTKVIRRQVKAPVFAATLQAELESMPGPMRWYASGVEQGVGDFMLPTVPTLRVVPASADKFVRAQKVAKAWNEGRVQVPANAEVLAVLPEYAHLSDDDRAAAPEWLPEFLDEVGSFTGVNDAEDDQVDGFAAGHDELEDGCPAYDDSYDEYLPQNRI